MLIISCDVPKSLSSLLPPHIVTSPADTLPRAVAAHPDMLLHAAPKKIIASPSAYSYIKNSICGNTDLKPCYPLDIAYNCFYINKTLICKKEYTDSIILDYYTRIGFDIIGVKQGYTACSTLKISDSAVITADRGIYDAVLHAGGKALLIASGHITLKGYSEGFIGGAGGIIKKGVVALFGNIESHPDCKKMTQFAKDNKTELISLSDMPLSDFGGITRL